MNYKSKNPECHSHDTVNHVIFPKRACELMIDLLRNTQCFTFYNNAYAICCYQCSFL